MQYQEEVLLFSAAQNMLLLTCIWLMRFAHKMTTIHLWTVMTDGFAEGTDDV